VGPPELPPSPQTILPAGEVPTGYTHAAYRRAASSSLRLRRPQVQADLITNSNPILSLPIPTRTTRNSEGAWHLVLWQYAPPPPPR
jgi:hypothetical protein